MLKRIRTSLVASAIGITFAIGNAHAIVAVPSYNGVVIFGDSLSDTGNVLSLTTAFGQTPFPNYPGAAGRFSNGPAWTEYLANGLGFGSSANPSNLFYNPPPPDSTLPAGVPTGLMAIGAPGGQNYSYGGARTGLNGSAAGGTGLLGQLVAWDNSTSSIGGGALTRSADPDTLYVVVAGANDLRDIRSANFATDAASMQLRADAATGVAQGLISTLDLLATAGARHFLISSLPDLGLTPEAAALELVPGKAGIVDASREVTLSFNGALSSLAGSFEAGFNQANNVDLDIRTLDFYGLFNNVVNDANNNNGDKYGITNVATACINPVAPTVYFFNGATGPGCGVAGFSDPLHPSAKSHELLGALALQTVTAVPEPSAFALMIGGLLLIGGFARRRAQAA